MEKLLLTPVEAATALGVGRSKVYELMRAGTLPSIRIGSCRRVPVEEVVALVARLRGAGSDAQASESRRAGVRRTA